MLRKELKLGCVGIVNDGCSHNSVPVTPHLMAGCILLKHLICLSSLPPDTPLSRIQGSIISNYEPIYELADIIKLQESHVTWLMLGQLLKFLAPSGTCQRIALIRSCDSVPVSCTTGCSKLLLQASNRHFCPSFCITHFQFQNKLVFFFLQYAFTLQINTNTNHKIKCT